MYNITTLLNKYIKIYSLYMYICFIKEMKYFNNYGVVNMSDKIHKELNNWMKSEDSNEDIMNNLVDDVLEFLLDQECLNKKGLKLRNDFWSEYIKEKSESKIEKTYTEEEYNDLMKSKIKLRDDYERYLKTVIEYLEVKVFEQQKIIESQRKIINGD